MKKLIFIFFYIFSSSIYAEDAFDVIEKALVNKPIEESMQPWEKNLSKNEWKAILENCYDRNINQSAKSLLLKMLNKNGLNVGSSASARDNDNSLNMYCSHALSLADSIGFEVSVIPLNSNDIPAINRASFIRYCYDFRKKGFTKEFREQLKLIIGAGSEVLNLEQVNANSIRVISMVYVGTCGIMFSNFENAPVHVSFSEK